MTGFIVATMRRRGPAFGRLRVLRNAQFALAPRILVLVAWIASLATSASVNAGTASYQLLFDLDRNASTGCSIPAPSGPIAGIERAFVTTVTTGTSGGSVTGIAQRTCTGGLLGTPVNVAAGGWPIGFGNGIAGTAVVETFVARNLLGGGNPARVYLLASGNGDSDAIVAGIDGASIELVLGDTRGGPQVIPAQSSYALLALVALVCLLAMRSLRQRGAVAAVALICLTFGSVALVWAATVLLDGQIGDWSGIAPLATNPKGNAAKNADVTALFYQRDATRIYFRIDADIELDAIANRAPAVDAGVDQTIALPSDANLAGSATDDGLPNPPAVLTFAWSKVSGPGAVGFSSATNLSTTATFSVAGTYVLRLTANDGVLSAADDVRIVVDPPASSNERPIVDAGPDQTITLPGSANLAASASDDGLPSPPGELTIAWSTVSGPGLVTFGDATSASTTASFGVEGVYVVRLTASDGALSTSDDVQLTVIGGEIPPLVVSKIDPTVPATLFNSTAFLYTGPDAVQTGVATGTITARRAAVVRGNVLQKSGAPLAGVTVTIVGHPEFGTTKSRADGVFDLAVNGGGRLAVRYERSGYLPVQRQVATFPGEFAITPDVVLLPRDTQATTIDFSGGSTSMQVARGSVQTDADGTRRATVLIPAGTTAALVQPDGSTRPASALTLRFTEYTVGPMGRQAMPAQLPPSSLYTYAVELGADEALAKVDGRDVVFDRPVILHVENFLDIPTGETVPVGYYDPKRSAWIGAPNGQVIRVVSVGNGVANLDVDGDGRPDDAATLLALGIDDAERRQLVELYAPGAALWRTPLTHFSTFDLNYPYVCVPDDCTAPTEPPPPPKKCGQNGAAGSLIGCELQTLGEGVDLVGVPFSLHYASSRVPGRTEESVVRLSFGSSGAPAGSLVNEVEILVAGRSLRRTLSAGATQAIIEWDGKDAYGRDVRGSQPAVIRIGYTYRAALASAPREPNAWAQLSGVRMSAGRDRDGSTLTLWQERVGTLTRLDARSGGLGGWTLSELHAYDPLGGIVYLGNGTQSESGSLFGTNSGTIRTVAGGGTSTSDGVPATAALLNLPFRLAVGPDASIYFVDPVDHVVRRVTAEGVIDTVAGTRGAAGFEGDGGPAKQARLSQPTDIAIAADGSLYIVDFGNFRVRRVGADGIIRTIAGNGNALSSGDKGPATQAGMLPLSVAVGPDNNVYIGADNRIRMVDGAGIIAPYAATGEFGFSGDGGPARSAHLGGTPEGLAFGPDGSLYLTDASRIRQVTPQGIIKTVAGSNTVLFSGDGALATSAGIDPHGVAVDRDGAIYIADRGNSRLRRVGSDGIIRTVAGNGSGDEPDGALATRVSVPAIMSVAVGPEGRLYVIDAAEPVIRRIDPVLPADAINDVLLPSGDGSEVYVFDRNGRHLRTLDGLTGASRLRFTYDADGYPVSITDADGNVTTIERSGSIASAFVAPGGQRTLLATDANGWLTRVTNPAGEARNMEYSAQGLLQRFSDPRGNASRFSYDAFGRLTRDEDAAGGSTDLARTDQATGYTITTTSALGRVRKFQVEGLPGGEVRQVVTEPGGEKVVTIIATDGRRETTDAAGTISTIEYGPDPRWGMLVPTTTETITTPGGRSRTVETTRSVTLRDPRDPFSLISLGETKVDNGDTTTSEYDPVQRSFTFTSPRQRTATLQTDAIGRVVREQITGLAPTAYAYSSGGLLTSITTGAGTQRKSTFAYDALRQLTQAADPLGRNTRFAYDAVQRPIRQTLTDGRTIAASYDASGNLASLTPPARAAHLFDHGVVDLLTRYNPPDLAGVNADETSIIYNADRQPTNLALPDGRTVSRTYDNGGRLAAMAFSRGRIDVSYDPASGLPVRLDAPGGVRNSFAFDGSLILSDVVGGPVAGAIDYEYDDKFRVVSVSVNGDAVALAYDDDGLLAQAGALDLTRHADSGLITASTLNAVSEAIDYDEFAGVTDQRVRFNATDVYRAQFTRDPLGRPTRKIETTGSVTDTYDYAYDVAGRLVGVTRNGTASAAYAYDGNSNRTSYAGPLGNVPPAQVEVDAQDRMTRYGSNTYTYDANGTLATKVTAAGTTTYSYDEFGNLTRVALPNGTVVDYIVDGLHRRIAKRVNGVLTRQWLWDGPTRIAAELGGGAPVSRFVYATRRNVPDYIERGAIQYRLVTDQNGSPRLLIDSVTGSIAGSMNHDEFGRVIADSLSGLVPFGYAGGLYDPDTGLVRFGARDYDPEVGRWASRDPQLFAGQDTNLYAYVFNDPLTLVDPTGLQAAVLNLVPQPGPGNAGANANNRAIQEGIQKYTAGEDTFTVFAHCNGGCQDESGKSMSAEELGKKIERSENFDRSKHKKVRIAGCRVKGKYAQALKDYLERRGAGKETIEYSGPDQKVYPNSQTGNLQQGFNNSQPIRWQTLP